MSTPLTPPVGDADHVRGDPAASVTLVEYGDFECPHCGRAFPVIERVLERLGERVRFVYRHFPITESHPHAQHAAEAAESVAAQVGPDGFWAMHAAIFTNQRALDDAALAEYASLAGADRETVLEDLRTERYREKVRADFMSGVRSGVNGTPTFFIDGARYDGPRDEATLAAALG